ncbi:MAG: hypothetical protein FJX59_20300, partial [Alphaproteobacteria bacterium]|nr:hypothetical protein [Alphaproteobacteria bacterium]
MKSSEFSFARVAAVGFATAMLTGCAAVQSMRGDEGRGVLFPSIDGDAPPVEMAPAAPAMVSAEPMAAMADPLSATPPDGGMAVGGSQRVPLGALSSTPGTVAPFP